MRHRRTARWLAIPALAALALAGLAAEYPAWWTARGVLSNPPATNDYAAVNAGQLKWMASQAFAELQSSLPGGAGAAVSNLVLSFPSGSNYVAVNVGQLKAVAGPFYDRLIALGYTNAYPWSGATETNDYAALNVGQLKNVFSFEFLDTDGDGLLDADELAVYFTSPTNIDTDADGWGDYFECITNRTDPNNSDTTRPVVWFTDPTNGAERVWVP